MKNIYDIRYAEDLLFILSNKYTTYIPERGKLNKIAIAVNLFYLNTVENYLLYLNGIAEDIDIYIISSNPRVFELVKRYQKRKLTLLDKNNRGRDVSALLITFREIARNYEYICFLHDKKERHKYLKEDTRRWIFNLWENTLGSMAYLYNVLQIFEEKNDIGLLVPPEPLGDYIEAWYGETWGTNFANTKQLADRLKLVCDLCEEKQPITIGTVFWARTDSLKKLLEIDWQYDDFPQEPMPVDGTISHAIERILGYVVQDAGFKTGTVMASSYAEWSLLYLQENMRKMHALMRDKLDVHNMHQVNNLSKQEVAIKTFFNSNDKVYFYGAGVYGKKLLKRVRCWGLNPIAFLVGNGRKKESYINGLRVYELQEIDLTENDGIVIAVHYDLQDEIENEFRVLGIHNFIVGYV